ncbi:MAG: pilin [Candidatus Saccharimonadales bacterium]|nr:pilin [Candidatus Saccharimonadales bacterium]
MLKADTINRTKNIGLVSMTTVAVLLASRSKVLGTDSADVDLTRGIEGGSEDAAGTTQEGTTLFGGDNSIFRTVTNILLFLVGAISVIMLVIGGIRYVVSGGDQQAVTNAKNTILYAIVGIVVAFLAFAAVQFVSNQLESTQTAPAG